LVRLHDRKQQRIHRPTGVSFRRWFPIAATVLFAVVFFFDHHGAVIQADELVQSAANVERARPTGASLHLRITHLPASAALRTAGFGFDAEMTDGFVVPTSVAAAPAGTPATLARMLAQHRFAWREPLNVAHFNDWRSRLSRKRDEVIDLRASGQIT